MQLRIQFQIKLPHCQCVLIASTLTWSMYYFISELTNTLFSDQHSVNNNFILDLKRIQMQSSTNKGTLLKLCRISTRVLLFYRTPLSNSLPERINYFVQNVKIEGVNPLASFSVWGKQIWVSKIWEDGRAAGKLVLNGTPSGCADSAAEARCSPRSLCHHPTHSELWNQTLGGILSILMK